MKQVEIRYNPYKYQFYYYIDGKAITSQSHDKANVLSKQNMPFHTWVEDIFPALDADINQEYELTFKGREVEINILSLYVTKSRFCKKFITKPIKGENSWQRLAHLEQLCEKEDVHRNVTESLPVYTDDLELAKKSGLENVWPHSNMYQGPILYKEVETLYEDSSNFAFVLLFHHSSTELNMSGLRYGRVYVIGIGDNQTALMKNNNTYLIDIPREYAKEIIELLIDYEILPYLLSSSVDQCFTSIQNRTELDIILETDVLVIVSPFPKNGDGVFILEDNQVYTPEITCYPHEEEVPELWITSSNPNVVRVSENRLFWVSPGECTINFRVAGNPATIYEEKIICVHRNRIQRIQLQQNTLELRQGMVFTPQFTYYPEDADNADQIQFLCSNDCISLNHQGSLIANYPGECTVTIQAENVDVSMIVLVSPPMVGYKITPEFLKMVIGESRKLEIDPIPNDAYFGSYHVEVTPSGVIEYDKSTDVVLAVNPGTAEIRVIEDDGGCVGISRIKVKSEQNTAWIKVAIAGIVGIILIFIVYNMLF